MKLTVNGIERELVSSALTPLLHVLREELGLVIGKERRFHRLDQELAQRSVRVEVRALDRHA